MYPSRCRLRIAGGALAVAIAVALVPAGASAAEDRSGSVPAGLTDSFPTPHFVVHYNPATPSPVAGMTIAEYAKAGAEDFENAYARDVIGGGVAPNAGLGPPTPDSDGKTDVYLSAPADLPAFHGGLVSPDVYPTKSSTKSAYIFMTPDMNRQQFRFRAAHEFMHVIQDAYAWVTNGGPLGEGFADWAAAWATPDTAPQDNNFAGTQYPNAPHPWTSLDCETSQCGAGYWQWMFIQDQVQAYGPSFVTGFYERYAAGFGSGNAFAGGYWLDQEIRAISGGGQSLSTRFATYADDVWDPTRWSVDSLRVLRDTYGSQPAAFTYEGGSTTDSGWQNVTIDHLATRYVRVRNASVKAASNAVLVISWQRPDGMAAPVTPIVHYTGRAGWDNAAAVGGTQGTLRLSFDPARVADVVVPLVNDSMTADGQPFSYRVQILDSPDNMAPPLVSGPRTVGSKLSADPGGWEGTAPLAYAYRWQRCTRSCVDIPGARSKTYVPSAADLGARVRVLVTASNVVGSATAVSDLVGPIAPNAAQIKAALLRGLAPSGGAAKIGALLRRGGYQHVFRAPWTGTITVSWYQVPRGAHVSKAAPVLVATGHARVAGARVARFKIGLTKRGRQLLQHARSLRLTAKATFVAARIQRVSTTKGFTLRR